MADFSYMGSGSIEALGNAYCYTIDIFLYKFRVGDFAYVRENAIRGKLFKVRVAKVFLNNTSLNYNKKVSLYEDSTGSLYNESDLITYEEASELIQLSPWAGVTEPYTYQEGDLILYPRPEVVSAPIVAQYGPGDVAWSLPDAMRGDLVKVVIKRAISEMVFEDQLNGLWNLEDLVDEEVAVNTASGFATASFHNELELLRYAQSIPIESLNEVYATYSPGDFVWSLPDARRGDLLKVVIKKVISQNVFEDQLNGLWNLDDLVDEITATNIAYNYWLRRKRKIQKAVLNDPLVRPPVQRPY